MNICIVDDDKYVVEKIVEGVDWERFGIEGIYTACNIRQAREILGTKQIDILLSDIEMPHGSGLELLEWIREQKLPVECIYLSSYAHFAYAQKALELHSMGYLLKPVSNRELESALEKAVNQIQAMGGGKSQNEQKSREKFWQSMLLEKEIELFISGKKNTEIPSAEKGNTETLTTGKKRAENLLAGEAGASPHPAEEKEILAFYGDAPLQLCLLRIFGTAQLRKPRESALLELTLRHMLEEYLRAKGSVLDVILRYSGNCFLTVIKNFQDTEKERKANLADMLSAIEKEHHIKACIYAGEQAAIRDSRKKLSLLLQMEHEGVPGEDGVLLEEEWRGREALYTPPDFQGFEQKMMHGQDIEGVALEMIGYVEKLWQEDRANVAVFSQFKADLQQMLFHYMMENGIVMTQIFETGEYEAYYDKAALTLRDMKEFISILFRKLKAVIKAESTEENVVEQIIRYIDENISGDLSRANLASQIYISEDYLSKKFISHTGMSIPSFVAVRRMEKARDYFRNTSLSVSEVAMKVGYTNFSYFSKTFRDYAGCTPGEFRGRNNKNLTY